MNLYFIISFYLKIFIQVFIFLSFFSVAYGSVTFNPRLFVQEDVGVQIVRDKSIVRYYNKYAFGASLRRGCFIVSGNLGKFQNVFLSYYFQFNFAQTDGTKTNLSKGYLKIASSNYFLKIGQSNSLIGIEPNISLSDYMFLESAIVTSSFLTKQTFGIQFKYFLKKEFFNKLDSYFNIFLSVSLDDINYNSKTELINIMRVLSVPKDKCFFMFKFIFLPVNNLFSVLHFGINIQYAINNTTPLIINTHMECRERNYNIKRTHQIMGTGKRKNSVNSYIFGFENICVFKNVNFQSEIFYNFIKWDPPIDPSYYNGMYFQIGYFLTGEKHPYIISSGALSTPRVTKYYGAFELAFRFSYVDMHISEDIIVFPETGKVSACTFGINWYFNAKLKFQLNYVHTTFIYNDEEIDRFRKFSSLGSRIQFSM